MMKLALIIGFIVFVSSDENKDFIDDIEEAIEDGCFTPFLCKDSVIEKESKHLPIKDEDFDARSETEFVLQKKDSKSHTITLGDVTSLLESGFDKNKPTKLIIHGYLNSVDSYINEVISLAYNQNHDVNVIQVGWEAGSMTHCYIRAKKRVRDVGKVIAEFLDFALGDDAQAWKTLTLVGHSLGSHISGFAGKNVKNGKIGTIVALDPAGPLYREETEDFRLNKNDAEYVEAIHTDQDCYGIEDQLGHADFYVNDGDDQPGCMTHVCSHSRSISYFAESLENSQSFKSTRCESEDGAKAFMGGQPGNMDKGITGKFCVETDDDYPFGSGDNKNLDIDDLYALFR